MHNKLYKLEAISFITQTSTSEIQYHYILHVFYKLRRAMKCQKEAIATTMLMKKVEEQTPKAIASFDKSINKTLNRNKRILQK